MLKLISNRLSRKVNICYAELDQLLSLSDQKYVQRTNDT